MRVDWKLNIELSIFASRSRSLNTLSCPSPRPAILVFALLPKDAHSHEGRIVYFCQCWRIDKSHRNYEMDADINAPVSRTSTGYLQSKWRIHTELYVFSEFTHRLQYGRSRSFYRYLPTVFLLFCSSRIEDRHRLRQSDNGRVNMWINALHDACILMCDEMRFFLQSVLFAGTLFKTSIV